MFQTDLSCMLIEYGNICLFQNRMKVLSSAYQRALKDPFPPARQAGILAMAASHNYFTLAESANRLLPALCAVTMDPEKTVRDQAFKAIKCFLGKLEKVSETPELVADMGKQLELCLCFVLTTLLPSDFSLL